MQVYLKRYGVGAKGRTWSMESRSKKFVSSPVCLDWLYAVGTVLLPPGVNPIAVNKYIISYIIAYQYLNFV